MPTTKKCRPPPPRPQNVLKIDVASQRLADNVQGRVEGIVSGKIITH